MRQKAVTLINRGMNRDMSVSKIDGSSAYENRNIRITVRDNDTMLSVTNERGNKEVDLGTLIAGELLGWNVLNNHIILFTHEGESTDRIYRIDYVDGGFEPNLLFTGDLGFDMSCPIESIVYHETEAIQKIYWVDGIHVLRFMNFMAEKEERDNWDTNSFDSTIFSDYSISVDISKDYSGVNRANGVAQYLITYYNKHGQESGYAWVSDLVYMTPRNVGGSADGTNSCKVTLTINFDDDNKFTNFRVYSIFRSSLNQALVAYIVADGEIVHGEPVTVADDGAHLVTEDISRLLYLGSQEVKPYTITHKDQTLFLGGLESTGQDYGWIREEIKSWNIYDEETGLINTISGDLRWVQFYYEDGPAYDSDGGSYSYDSQLVNTSSDILSFKGGEKYRFALSFRLPSGATTPAFWIGDAVNPLYPYIDKENNVIKRVAARLIIHRDLYTALGNKFAAVQLMIAEPTYSDRSVKAQGIINPTMFNVWERYNDRVYAYSSWISRPRNSGFAWRHFDPVRNSTSSLGEIECNYWTPSAEQQNGVPGPDYKISNYGTNDEAYNEIFDGIPDYDYLMLVFGAQRHNSQLAPTHKFSSRVTVVKVKLNGSGTFNDISGLDFSAISSHVTTKIDWPNSIIMSYEDPDGKFSLIISNSFSMTGSGTGNTSRKSAYTAAVNYLRDVAGITNPNYIPDFSVYDTWFEEANGDPRTWKYFNKQFSSTSYPTDVEALDANNHSSARWIQAVDGSGNGHGKYAPSYYKKHLMFVDENTVTLDSPEISYEAVQFDNAETYKLRIVGVARISSGYSDYTVDASHGNLSGDNLVRESFNNADGLLSWPLWRDYDLVPKDTEISKDTEIDPAEMKASDYKWGGGIVRYWLHMWGKTGSITGFKDTELDGDNDYSVLRSKVFANMRYSNSTIYTRTPLEYDLDSLRLFNYTSNQFVGLNIGQERKYYDGVVSTALSMPGSHKYPVLYSLGSPSTDSATESDMAFLYSDTPVQISFSSNPHAVISLHTEPEKTMSGSAYPCYCQDILPAMFNSERFTNFVESSTMTGRLVPWIDFPEDRASYPYKNYMASQATFNLDSFSGADTISDGDRYLYVGEIYQDFDAEGAVDTRYGGITEFAVENNRFIPAGPMTRISEMEPFYYLTQHVPFGYVAIGDRGDTYFQRWDCLKTRPSSAAANSANNVIDITSVMLETHINLDGRTDNLRGTKYLASIDPEKYGTLNPVYSQTDNFFSSRQLDEDMDQDVYRSSITWTLDKTDSADIDEWTHITLANSLKLDGDKGSCRALRRFNNSIIAFQDRAISEILFNSRTQISTTDGVPVEIGNSGKVDGKRYITNKFGCVNKWSIVEGKAALYFVDNINKAFCAFGGQGIQPLSTKLGFDAWFRRINSVEPWAPDETFNNMVAYYDRIHSDVYLVGTGEGYGDIPCLVYNETLGVFTSFFDYSRVPMMANVEDRFVSVRDHKLWLQNEGLYCNFFGTDYGYDIEYRATPDPYGDKIWTNVDYRADYYSLLDDSGNSVVPERLMINGEFYDDVAGTYQDTKTFDSLRIWNEYQNTGEVTLGRDYTTERTTRRKFRIWHVAIPRSVKTDRNKWGLDRIRNPWISLLFSKKASADNRKDMAQIHDVTVRYFE